jgi:hypothetical protein
LPYQRRRKPLVELREEANKKRRKNATEPKKKRGTAEDQESSVTKEMPIF